MTRHRVHIRVGEAPDVQAYLAERIYEFNANVTGYFDGESFFATQTDETGVVCAGVCGYTWGGCAYVSYLWVEQSQRGRGVGSALLAAAEEHAKAKGCKLVFLATHSFQAPKFYEERGYRRQASVADHPPGHASLVLAKPLRP
jgi:GNAT superfamily N-acetyltransferase